MMRRERSRERSYSPRRRYDDRSNYRREDRSYYRRDYYDRSYRDDRDSYHRSDRYERGSGGGGSGGGSGGSGGYYDRYDDRRSYHRLPPRPRPRRPVDRGSDEDRKISTTLFVGNLPYAFRERDVASMFERYGRLNKVTVPMDSVTSKNKGFSFVEFEDRRDAEDAFDKFQGFSVEGRRLKLDWDIGLSKKDEHRTVRPSGPPPPPLDDRLPMAPGSDPYAAPPPMDSRGYRRDSPDPYRR
ncbi:hypothetical protein DFQ28_000755 [Apophysomyces sp. BC1034]|nr:hypothetical protein DFQ28_000755 [Apophysomyces sp. BC1034]